jgi:chondroitin 4-sulfotransferase 11
MIISHKYRYVFLHIPKTAGTSIEQALGLRAGKDGGWTPGTCKIAGRTKHHIEPHMIPKGYFVFTFVRNPWDRILSYYMFRREPRSRHRRSIHPDERKISYRDWLLRLAEFSRYRHINPAFQIAISSQNRLIRDHPHFIGRYENLAEDFLHICTQVGLQPRPLQKVNPTTQKKRPYADYYTEETAKIVARLYCDDIERFGYRFQGVL